TPTMTPATMTAPAPRLTMTTPTTPARATARATATTTTTTTTTTTMTTTERRVRRWPPRLRLNLPPRLHLRPRLSLRMRLLGWALLLLTVASLASVVTIRQVLLNQMENRVSESLEHEVAEFRLLADGNDPETGRPFGTDLARIAEDYLSRTEPQAGEQV